MFNTMAKRRKQIQPRSGVEKAFGQIVRTIRQDELSISQAELEKRTGLNRTFISDLERGIQGPGIRTIFRIAKALRPLLALFYAVQLSPNSLCSRLARNSTENTAISPHLQQEYRLLANSRVRDSSVSCLYIQWRVRPKFCLEEKCVQSERPHICHEKIPLRG